MFSLYRRIHQNYNSKKSLYNHRRFPASCRHFRMDRKPSSELLNLEPLHMKNASSDSLASDSKSSSLNSKLGQDSVSFENIYSLLI